MFMFYVIIEKNSNGIGKPIEAQVQRKPCHSISDMVREKAKPFDAIDGAFDVLYIYT